MGWSWYWAVNELWRRGHSMNGREIATLSFPPSRLLSEISVTSLIPCPPCLPVSHPVDR